VWLFEFEHFRIAMCVYDYIDDQEQHPRPFWKKSTHWTRLRFEYEGDPKDRKANISLLP
jgi:hypothetical protein